MKHLRVSFSKKAMSQSLNLRSMGNI